MKLKKLLVNFIDEPSEITMSKIIEYFEQEVSIDEIAQLAFTLASSGENTRLYYM